MSFPFRKKKNKNKGLEIWPAWHCLNVWTPYFNSRRQTGFDPKRELPPFWMASPVTAAKSPTDDVPLPARSYDTLLGLQDRSAVPPLPGLNLTACRRSNAACSFEKQQRSLSKTKMDMLGNTKKMEFSRIAFELDLEGVKWSWIYVWWSVMFSPWKS